MPGVSADDTDGPHAPTRTTRAARPWSRRVDIAIPGARTGLQRSTSRRGACRPIGPSKALLPQQRPSRGRDPCSALEAERAVRPRGWALRLVSLSTGEQTSGTSPPRHRPTEHGSRGDLFPTLRIVTVRIEEEAAPRRRGGAAGPTSNQPSSSGWAAIISTSTSASLGSSSTATAARAGGLSSK